MFNYGSNPTHQPEHQALLRNQRQQAHLSQVKQLMETIYNLQNQSELHVLSNYIKSTQMEYSHEIEECFKNEGVDKHDEQFMREVRERCLKMKKKNEILLMELFNLKEKISRMMYMSIEKDHAKETEFNMVQEKIRRVKMEISNKLQQLRTKRMLNRQPKESAREKPIKYQPVKTALTELKNATEIVDRELIKQRQQIKVLVKQLYGDDI